MSRTVRKFPHYRYGRDPEIGELRRRWRVEKYTLAPGDEGSKEKAKVGRFSKRDRSFCKKNKKNNLHYFVYMLTRHKYTCVFCGQETWITSKQLLTTVTYHDMIILRVCTPQLIQTLPLERHILNNLTVRKFKN